MKYKTKQKIGVVSLLLILVLLLWQLVHARSLGEAAFDSFFALVLAYAPFRMLRPDNNSGKDSSQKANSE